MRSDKEQTRDSIHPMTRDSIPPMTRNLNRPTTRDFIPPMTSYLEGGPFIPVAASPVPPEAASHFKGPEDDEVSEGQEEEGEEEASVSEKVSHLTNQVGIATGFVTPSFSTPIPTPPMTEDCVSTPRSAVPTVPVVTSSLRVGSQVQVHLENPGPEEIDVLYDGPPKQEGVATVGSWAPGEAKRFSVNPGDNIFIRTAEGSLIQTYNVKPFPLVQSIRASPPPLEGIEVQIENPNPQPLRITQVLPENASEDSELRAKFNTITGPGTTCVVRAMPGDQLLVETTDSSFMGSFEVARLPHRQRFAAIPQPEATTDVPTKVKMIVDNPSSEPLYLFLAPRTDDYSVSPVGSSSCEQEEQDEEENQKREMSMGYSPPRNSLALWAVPGDHFVVRKARGELVGEFDAAPFPIEQIFRPRLTTVVPERASSPSEQNFRPRVTITSVPPGARTRSKQSRSPIPIKFSPQLTQWMPTGKSREIKRPMSPPQHRPPSECALPSVANIQCPIVPVLKQTLEPMGTQGKPMGPVQYKPPVVGSINGPISPLQCAPPFRANNQRPIAPMLCGPQAHTNVQQPMLQPRPIFNESFGPQADTNVQQPLLQPRPIVNESFGPQADTNVQQPILQPRPIVNESFGPQADTNEQQPILHSGPTVNKSQEKDLEGGIGNYGAMEAVEKSDEPKETLIKPKVRDEKLTVSIPLAISCVLVPVTIFCVTYGFFGFYIRYGAAWVSYIVIVLMCLSCFGLGAIAFMKESRTDQMWWSLMCVLSLVGWTWAVIGSNYTFELWSQPYYDLQRLNVYQHVDPSKDQGNEYMDFGILNFVHGATLDRNLSMHFKNHDFYCVAPVHMIGSKPSSYDFWAVGTNCCFQHDTHSYDFQCGDWNSPIARSGVRVAVQARQEFFELATKQAATKYGIPVRNPVFFQWVEDPSDQISGFDNAAGDSFFIAFVKFGCSESLIVFLFLLPFAKRWV